MLEGQAGDHRGLPGGGGGKFQQACGQAGDGSEKNGQLGSASSTSRVSVCSVPQAPPEQQWDGKTHL